MVLIAFGLLELLRREQQQRAQLEAVSLECDQSKSRLEHKREELRLCEEELEKREYVNESERRKLEYEKKMVLKHVLI